MGKIDSNAGNSVTEYTKAHIAPNATMLPMIRKGGISEKFRLRKPIAVVSEVRNTGHTLTFTELMAATLRVIPLRMPSAITCIT